MATEYDNAEFGAKLRGYRAMRRMSQQELAGASGIDQNSIARYETGGTTSGLDKAVALARALGVTLNELYPIDEGGAV